jgi:hypothetical protein
MAYVCIITVTTALPNYQSVFSQCFPLSLVSQVLVSLCSQTLKVGCILCDIGPLQLRLKRTLQPFMSPVSTLKLLVLFVQRCQVSEFTAPSVSTSLSQVPERARPSPFVATVLPYRKGIVF